MLTALLAAVAFAPNWSLVNAQTSNATCSSEFNWAENSLDQNPCVMAAYLRAACKGNHQINALPEGYHYNGPSDPEYSEPCWCSSVTYSLYAACQVCQGRASSLFTWGEWSTNCSVSDTANGYFPRDIPSGTAIPAWAFEKTYLRSEAFSSVEAQNYAATNQTEVIRAAAPQPSSPSSPSPSPSPSATGSNNGGNNNGGNNGNGNNNGGNTNGNGNSNGGSSNDDGGSNTGAIVGGVVGGLGGLALIAGLIFFFMRRNKKKNQGTPLVQSSQPPMTQGGYQQSPFTPPPPTPGYTLAGDASSVKYYNPADPATFPPQSTSPTLYSHSPPIQPNSGQGFHPQPNRYSAHPNVPEL